MSMEAIVPGRAFVVAASMGGLISLLLVRQIGHGRLHGLINIEGKLALKIACSQGAQPPLPSKSCP